MVGDIFLSESKVTLLISRFLPEEFVLPPLPSHRSNRDASRSTPVNKCCERLDTDSLFFHEISYETVALSVHPDEIMAIGDQQQGTCGDMVGKTAGE